MTEPRRFTQTDAFPAQSLAAVTPSDDDDLARGVCKALWIGTGGAVSIRAEKDSDPVVIAGVADGTLLPMRAIRVMSTDTTASNIVALY